MKNVENENMNSDVHTSHNETKGVSVIWYVVSFVAVSIYTIAALNW